MSRADLLEIAREGNVAAFLRVIRACEGTAADNGYAVTYAYQPIQSFQDHPRRKVTAGGYTSTAAGAYQIVERTWDEVREQHDLPDFSPESQDAAAIALLIRRKALDAIRAGALDAAVAACNREWASLPGSPYGQPTRDMAYVRKVFAAYGGRELWSAAPVEARTQPTVSQPVSAEHTTEGTRMGPFILPALDALVSLLPTLSRLFKGESPSRVAERNAAAVEEVAKVVLPAILKATQAENAQAAVERVSSLPELAKAADDAVRMSYAELSDIAERSIAQRQDFVMRYVAQRDVRTVVGRFTFPEMLSVVFVSLASLGIGYLLVSRQLSGELLGSVVTLMLIGGWTEIRKFWFSGASLMDADERKRGGER